jgi:hypothetical protein
MAVCRSTIERNTPRRMRCRVILEKKFSTALSQEAEVGLGPPPAYAHARELP